MPETVFYVDPSDEIPVYRQLMDQIRLHVATGVLASGDPLPSTRSLSADLGVNPMTVSKAYSLLEREGVLERRPGRPHVVAAVPTAEAREDRVALLRESMESAVRMARQLDVSGDDASKVFRAMFPAGPKSRRHVPDKER